MTQSSKGERLFGTDGIRGTPGEYPLTDGMIFKIGSSIARVILYKKQKKEKYKVIIGKDTRLSGQRIETLLSDAVIHYGIDVYLAGIITTPGLSFLVRELDADMGIMISASHNKPTDNGIKFFTNGGYKLLPEEEKWIEDIIFGNLISSQEGYHQTPKGTVMPLEDAHPRYLNFLKSAMAGVDLEGMRVALDCAWGATSLFAKKLFEELGATVCSIHDLPQGENINAGGTMNPSFLRNLVLEDETDVGIAFDGDGDRGMIIDEKGNILDGDYILAIVARHLLGQNKLKKNTVVGTVMSNYGCKKSIEEKGGKVVVASVGDKHVLEEMLKNGLSIGGEQSGHIIFLDYLPTPDGMLTALEILKVMKETKQPLSTLSQCMTKYPQILLNIKVKEKVPLESIPSVRKKLAEFNAQLKDTGRILLRYSGTEALARVMVEGKDKEEIESIAHSLADQIKEEIGVSE